MVTTAAILFAVVCMSNCVVGFDSTPGWPKTTLALYNFNVGVFQGFVNVGTDYPLELSKLLDVKTQEKLAAFLSLAVNSENQLKMVTNVIMELFGLYPNFNQLDKIVLNNASFCLNV